MFKGETHAFSFFQLAEAVSCYNFGSRGRTFVFSSFKSLLSEWEWFQSHSDPKPDEIAVSSFVFVSRDPFHFQFQKH